MKKCGRGFLLACLLLAACLLIPGVKAQAEPKAFEYILPDADTKVYTEEELMDMTAQVACYARNEIYARHGRKFRSAELMAWFLEQPWYMGSIEPRDFSDNMLNAYESSNVDLLLKLEKSRTADGSGYHLDEAGYTAEEVTDYLYGASGGDGFNILEGLEVYSTAATVFMDGKYFYMMVPNDLNWSYNQTAGNEFEIFYKPARDTGFGGHVVTIMALDLDDNFYQELPHYSICGESSEKRFVAMLPTDVQYNPNDSVQSREYGQLMEWAYTLDMNAEDGKNPFEVVEEEADAEVMPVTDRAE